MKSFKTVLRLGLVLILMLSCSSEDNSSAPTLPTTSDNIPVKSSDKDLLSLELESGTETFTTSISNLQVSNDAPLPFLSEQAAIKAFQISSKATINITVGQILALDESPFTLTVTAEDGSTKQYELTMDRDEGLQLSPNANIELGSSFTLQNSDVYVDGLQLAQDFNRFHEKAYADFNNDGHTDVLIASGLFQSYEYSPISLFLGDGSAVNADYCECGGVCNNYFCAGFTKLENALPIGYEGLQHPRKIVTGDFNGDNLLDAFIIGTGYDASPFPGESPVFLLNNGNGFDYEKLTAVNGFYHGGATADVDHDGDLDIFMVGVPSPVDVLFLLNDGTGNFTPTSAYIDEAFHHNTNYYTAEFIDIDVDGFMDLIIAGHEHEESATYILWGNSSGKYYKALSTVLPEVEGYNIVVDIDAHDIDNDGDKDILLNRVDSNSFYQNYYVQVIKNMDNTAFTDVSSGSIMNNTGENWFLWLHLQDLNNDGNVDIYLENDARPNLKWFNDGSGNFSQ